MKSEQMLSLFEEQELMVDREEVKETGRTTIIEDIIVEDAIVEDAMTKETRKERAKKSWDLSANSYALHGTLIKNKAVLEELLPYLNEDLHSKVVDGHFVKIWDPLGQPEEYRFPVEGCIGQAHRCFDLEACPYPTCRSLLLIPTNRPNGKYRTPCCNTTYWLFHSSLGSPRPQLYDSETETAEEILKRLGKGPQQRQSPHINHEGFKDNIIYKMYEKFGDEYHEKLSDEQRQVLQWPEHEPILQSILDSGMFERRWRLEYYGHHQISREFEFHGVIQANRKAWQKLMTVHAKQHGFAFARPYRVTDIETSICIHRSFGNDTWN